MLRSGLEVLKGLESSNSSLYFLYCVFFSRLLVARVLGVPQSILGQLVENATNLIPHNLASPMKLTLRPEWRPRPFTTFLGFVDIKTGVKITILFAVINKVAGVYGLLAMLTGAGGSLAQLSMYLYSVIALAAYVVGFKAVSLVRSCNPLLLTRLISFHFRYFGD